MLGDQRVTLPASVLVGTPGPRRLQRARARGRDPPRAPRRPATRRRRRCPGSAARCGSPRRCRPERLVYATVAAPPVVTEDVLEIAKDVDEAAVERLEEFADEAFVLACARFDITSPEPGPRRVRVRRRRRPAPLLRPRLGRGDPLSGRSGPDRRRGHDHFPSPLRVGATRPARRRRGRRRAHLPGRAPRDARGPR